MPVRTYWKTRLRAELKSRCRSVPASQRLEQSCRLADRLAEWLSRQHVGGLVLYAARQFEIEVAELRGWADRSDVKVYYPKVSPENESMGFVFVGPGQELVPGAFSILEPQGNTPRLTPGSLPVAVLVPGIAFDQCGRRIGSGRGYYDRALRNLSGRVLPIGVGYEFQIRCSLPEDDWDERMDFLATESGIVDCRDSRRAMLAHSAGVSPGE